MFLKTDIKNISNTMTYSVKCALNDLQTRLGNKNSVSKQSSKLQNILFINGNSHGHLYKLS